MASNTLTDITTYQCINSSKEFFLDTNVLYWYTNPRVNDQNDLEKRAQPYYTFVDALTAAGNPLYTSVYNLSELLNVIEKNEFDFYIKQHPEDAHLTRKDFRHIGAEREKVKKLMKTALANVHNICNVVEFPFSSDSIDEFVNNFTNHRCDVFDYLIINDCLDKQHLNIISDDNDFSSVKGISLFTANMTTLTDI